MSRKKKETVEFRFYEIPQGDAALVLRGQAWERTYGKEQTNLHFHNLAEIGICRHGAGIMTYEDRDLRYMDGTLTIIPANYPHVTISDGEETNLWEYIFFDVDAVLDRLFPDNILFRRKAADSINRTALIAQKMELPEITYFVDSVIGEAGNESAFSQQLTWLAMESLVLHLIRLDESLDEDEGSTHGTNLGQISAALEYVNAHYAEPIKASDLADLCSLSETHFRRLFESNINMSPIDYVNLVRIQKACEMIKKTNYSMETVAEKCGFTTVATFNRNFRKFLDTSPYQWKIHPDNYENKLMNFHISALKGW